MKEGVGRQKSVERKQESGHARQTVVARKSAVQPSRRFRGQEPAHDDESKKDSYQAQHHAYERQYRHIEYHERRSVRGGLSKSEGRFPGKTAKANNLPERRLGVFGLHFRRSTGCKD